MMMLMRNGNAKWQCETAVQNGGAERQRETALPSRCWGGNFCAADWPIPAPSAGWRRVCHQHVFDEQSVPPISNLTHSFMIDGEEWIELKSRELMFLQACLFPCSPQKV